MQDTLFSAELVHYSTQLCWGLFSKSALDGLFPLPAQRLVQHSETQQLPLDHQMLQLRHKQTGTWLKALLWHWAPQAKKGSRLGVRQGG